jgi:phage terminase small subunit
MAARKYRSTLPTEAERGADKYIGPKGGKAKPPKDEGPARGEDTTVVPLVGTSIPFPPPKPAPLPKLTMKEALFIQEYLVDFNGTAAAIRAGYSVKSAAVIAYENLRKPHIRIAVDEAKRHLLEQAGFNHLQLLAILLQDLNADDNDLFDEHGCLRPREDWPIAYRKGLVAGYKVEQLYAGSGADRVAVGTITEIKMASRTDIKRMIGQHVAVGAFVKDKPKSDEPTSTPLQDLANELKGSALRPKQIEGRARDITAGTAPAVLRPRE